MKGFTLTELLIVIGITLMLAVAAAPIYSGLQVSAQLNENTSQMIQALRTARVESVAGVNNSRHGVKFDSNTYTLYQGNSYATRDANYDRVHTLDEVLSITHTITDGDVNFTKNKGKVENTGTITLTHDVAGSKTIIVNSMGVVEEE